MSDKTQDLIALQKGIARLRKSNSWLKLGLTDSDFNNPDIQNYLLRPLGTDIEKDIEIENKLKAAVYLAVSRSKWKPRGIAKKLAEASVEALRDARLMSLFESEQITAKQYREELENNLISKIASTYTKVKKRYGRKATKLGLTMAIAMTVGGPAGLIAGGIMLVSELVPKKTKQQIKNALKKGIKKIGDGISRGIENLCDRGAVVAPKIVKKVYETMELIGDTASRVVKPVMDVARSIGGSIKNGAKKVLNLLGL
ncbi:MAG: hypothetical protein HDR46_04180 [Bacteroides sp.]|nr:hypothetical protein [Bacteroides sp.]